MSVNLALIFRPFLDPCFNSGENLNGLARGDAEFVLAIHSNSGGLGKRDPLGDADFYPNGVNPLPPGCLSMSCAHHRAVAFFAESVYPGNENNFIGIKCDSLSSLNSNFCRTQGYPMGYATPHNLKGIFFLKTREDKPYGLNATKDATPVCNSPTKGPLAILGSLNSQNKPNQNATKSPNKNEYSQNFQNTEDSPSNQSSNDSSNYQNLQSAMNKQDSSNFPDTPSARETRPGLFDQVKMLFPLNLGRSRK